MPFTVKVNSSREKRKKKSGFDSQIHNKTKNFCIAKLDYDTVSIVYGEEYNIRSLENRKVSKYKNNFFLRSDFRNSGEFSFQSYYTHTYSKSMASPVGKPLLVPTMTFRLEPSMRLRSILAGLPQSVQNTYLKGKICISRIQMLRKRIFTLSSDIG